MVTSASTRKGDAGHRIGLAWPILAEVVRPSSVIMSRHPYVRTTVGHETNFKKEKY
jgi:hypothetical protein